MSNNEQGGEERVVSVTEKGQATIPKKFRDKLRIGAPGHVRFIMTPDDILVVEPAEHPTQFRGILQTDDTKATEILKEDREWDEQHVQQHIDRHLRSE